MEKKDLKYYQYIKTLNELPKKYINQSEEIIRLFNEYVASNKNFKYNKTYLNDSISDFFAICEVFEKKKEVVERFQNHININYESLNKWYIIIDHIFLIENSQLLSVLDALENIYTTPSMKKTTLEQELKLFNLYNMDHNNIIVKYYSNDLACTGITEKHNIYQEIQINDIVKESLTRRERNHGKKTETQK